mmetsp:Transcript_17407/g.22591  ORF Transcript_17407/g.22591 Transcript_17407/m.22591 type:complete len:137 (-) Transcript_17407:47-457(-)
MWGGLIDNEEKGNVSTCISDLGCIQPGGTLQCNGLANSEHGMTINVTNETNSWSTSLYIPWEVFSLPFQPSSSSPSSTFTTATSNVPWKYWRANFYRYDYPNGPNESYDNYELSAWSPTHTPSFHEPEMFGVLVFI